MASQESKIFQKAPINVPNLSGFNLDHTHACSLKTGQITPILCKFMIPNDRISMGVNSTIQLPPLASDAYGRVDLRFEAFFVPMRTLYGGWQDLVTFSADSNPVDGFKPNPYLPYLHIQTNLFEYEKYFGPGTLADFLGIKISKEIYESTEFFDIPNPFSFLAYQKIVDDWYRDTRLQKPLFSKYVNTFFTTTPAYNIPSQSMNGSGPVFFSPIMYDNSSLLTMHQRLWAKDYFTNGTTQPQAGDSVQLEFKVDEATMEGKFSIAGLRSANAIQQWLERNNLVGNRYAEQIFARTGVYPADAITGRALYLGSKVQNIYNKSVFQTTNESQSDVKNPFATVGAKYSSPIGVDSMSLVDEFKATEHGYFMIMATIVPKAIYATGIDRQFSYKHILEMPDALLQNVGDQQINEYEISSGNIDLMTDKPVGFAYTQRFAEHKFMLNKVSGLLRQGETLDAFVIQRAFNGSPQQGTAFIQIPQDYLDQITAVEASTSQFGAWCEFGFQGSLVSTLAPYSIPTLGDPRDTHTEIVEVGGKRL